jgi:hypothetical protein
MRHFLVIAGIAGFVGAVAAQPLAVVHQQPQPRSTIIRGKITGPNGAPIVGATVAASGRDTTVVVRSAHTDVNGAYTIIFSPAQSSYSIRVNAAGYADTSLVGAPELNPARPDSSQLWVRADVQLRPR